MMALVNRRTILKGAGVAIPLPLFESTQATALTSKVSHRSTKEWSASPTIMELPEGFFPKESGQNYETPPTLIALENIVVISPFSPIWITA